VGARWLRVTAALGVTIAAAIAAALVWTDRALDKELRLPANGVRIEIASGVSLTGVANDLRDRGLLDAPWLLALYGRYTGDATRIRAGEYELEPGTTPRTLLAKLVAGQIFLHQLTIIEGSRFRDVIAAVRAHPAIAPGSLGADELMAALGAPGVHPEGQFFPDTYRFPRGTSDVDLLRQARTALLQHLTTAWEKRRPDIEIGSEYEALILASIIEKETALASERRLISGVFHERLRRGMRLQTDPTVIYGLGDGYDGNLRRQDLERDTPYNTYTRNGLPPTPIALPGAAAIDAAVDPERTDAVYFVATGLGDGSHRFSATLEEHERAVDEYLRRLRSADR
jgi:UPF0755 protein